jgi:hypothetical protein
MGVHGGRLDGSSGLATGFSGCVDAGDEEVQQRDATRLGLGVEWRCGGRMGGCGRSGHAEELRGLRCYGGGGVDCVLRRYGGALGFKGGRGEEDKSGRGVRRGPLGGRRG